MAVNWVETVRRIGVKEVLIGALDEQVRERTDMRTAHTRARHPASACLSDNTLSLLFLMSR